MVTATRWPTWTYEPAEAAQATQVAVFPGSCGIPYLETLISPDGNWLATNCSVDGKFLVIQRNGSPSWDIPVACTFVENEADWASAISSILPYHWSNDSRYLYFEIFYCVEPSIGSWSWYYMDLVPDPLFVLDTQNGQWHQFTSRANLFSFSSTGRRLLYLLMSRGDFILDNGKTVVVRPSSIDLTVLDLRTGETIFFTLTDYLAAGYAIWSEDGTKVIFSAESGLPIYFPDAGPHMYTIFMVDLNTGKLIPIRSFQNSEKVIYPVEWLEDRNAVVLHAGVSAFDTDFDVLYLDLGTLEVLIKTPTP